MILIFSGWRCYEIKDERQKDNTRTANLLRCTFVQIGIYQRMKKTQSISSTTAFREHLFRNGHSTFWYRMETELQSFLPIFARLLPNYVEKDSANYLRQQCNGFPSTFYFVESSFLKVYGQGCNIVAVNISKRGNF